MSIAPEQVFTLGNSIALAGWLILILAPRRWRFLNALPRWVLPAVLAVGYTALMLPNMFSTDGGFDTIERVRILFNSDALLTAGWIHYLAFDLFVGGWIADRADEIGMSRLVQAPILLVTFMLGPIGLLLFLLTRQVWNALPNRLQAA